jgi:RHS repeat-associated protein
MRTFIRLMAAWLVAMAAQGHAATITYFHNDFAGSPIAATDQSGTVIWRESYRPYGERITNAATSSANKIWFTSRRQDAESGLVYMGARYYDPVIGRFMSPDPVQFVETNIHSFNRYAYADNNPFKFTDPDGRSPLSIAVRELLRQSGGGYALGVAADAVSQFAAWGDVDMKLAATSNAAIAGGAAGLLNGVFTATSPLARSAEAAKDFFQGTRYTDKVIAQMRQGDFHSFPESVKAFQAEGTVSRITGADGVSREMLRIPGEYAGKKGAFEFIKETEGTINHRLFRPAGE